MNIFLKLKAIAGSILLILLFIAVAYPQSSNKESQNDKARKRELKREAALNLWRLKKSIEKDGFYAARVALNIWRSTAVDAGTFDQRQYDEFKKQLYEKSARNSIQCFEYYLAESSFHDANMCLQTWKVHSQEIGIFDQEKYDDLREKLTSARAKKAEEKKRNIEKKKGIDPPRSRMR